MSADEEGNTAYGRISAAYFSTEIEFKFFYLPMNLLRTPERLNGMRAGSQTAPTARPVDIPAGSEWPIP